MPIITKSRNSENTTYEINSIKADEYIFEMQLKKQPRYEVSKNSSKILLGNTNSKSGLRATPTILINGYALPDYYKIEDLKYFIAL